MLAKIYQQKVEFLGNWYIMRNLKQEQRLGKENGR